MNEDTTLRFVPNHRRTGFKNRNKFQSTEIRRRRERAIVEIRKTKRDDVLSKRRNLDSVQNLEDSDEELGEIDGVHYKFLQDLPLYRASLYSDNVEAQTQATVAIRKMLSIEVNPPIDIVIKAGFVPRFIEFLHSSHRPLQLESSWALTNIASGTSEQTAVLVHLGAVSPFVELLKSADIGIKEQAIWCLGNIAGDSSAFRDAVLNANVLPPLLEILENTDRLSLLENSIWTLSNLCRGKLPRPEWSIISHAIPVLSKLIYSEDQHVLINCCWSVSYLVDNQPEKIQVVLETDIPKRLVALLSHESSAVQIPTLRAVGNIVTGTDEQTEVLVKHGVLPVLAHLLSSPHESIRREACWAISNIAAGSSSQVEAVIEHNLIPSLIHLMVNADFRTRKEACWVITNIASEGTRYPNRINYLVSQGCIPPLCELLKANDNRVTRIVLEALENILKVGDMDKANNNRPVNQYGLYIEEAGGLDLINQCQNNENYEIYELAYNIIDQFFSGDDDESVEDCELMPEVKGATFGFGTSH
jgi:HEAT repeat protein